MKLHRNAALSWNGRQLVVALRRLRMTAAEIAETLAMPLSTVSVVLKRNGVGNLGRIVGGAGWRVRGGPKHYSRRRAWRGALRRRVDGPGVLLVPALAVEAAGPASIVARAALLVLPAPLAITFAALGVRHP